MRQARHLLLSMNPAIRWKSKKSSATGCAPPSVALSRNKQPPPLRPPLNPRRATRPRHIKAAFLSSLSFCLLHFCCTSALCVLCASALSSFFALFLLLFAFCFLPSAFCLLLSAFSFFVPFNQFT